MTVTTFYPDPNVESTSVDGITGYDDADVTLSWSNLVNATGNVASDTGTVMQCYVIAGADSNLWRRLYRIATLFDTSALPDTDIVSSATLSLYVTSKDSTGLDPLINVSSVNLASNTAVGAADYAVANWGSTKFSTGILFSNFTTSAYNDFALNASGIATITTTGISKFGIRIENDIDNSSPTWSSLVEPVVTFSSADVSSTTQDPKLVVTHATASVKDFIQAGFIPFSR